MSALQALTRDLLRTDSSACVHFVTDAGEHVDTLLSEMKDRGRIANIGVVIAELRHAGVFVATCDASVGVSVQAMTGAIKEAMAFPEVSGTNWGALDERLSDLEWLPAVGYVLFWLRSQSLWCNSPREAGVLTEIWMGRAPGWASKAIPFHLVFVW